MKEFSDEGEPIREINLYVPNTVFFIFGNFSLNDITKNFKKKLQYQIRFLDVYGV